MKLKRQKYYEFIDCLGNLSIQERIRLGEIYFKDAEKYKNELGLHYQVLNREFKRVIEGCEPYNRGLAAVLYGFWKNKDTFPALKDDLMAEKRYILAFPMLSRGD